MIIILCITNYVITFNILIIMILSTINHFSQLSKDSYTSLEVEMEQSAMVTNPQFSPVSVYDYYDPGIEILLVQWARKVRS